MKDTVEVEMAELKAQDEAEGVGEKEDISPLSEVVVPELPIHHIREEERGPIRMLIYGPSGAGKTYLAGSAALVEEMKPVLLIDTVAESGTMSVSDSDLDVLRVTRSLELGKFAGGMQSGAFEYKTIILDNLQEFYNLLMQEQLSAEAPGKGRIHPQVPVRQDYLICTARIRALLRLFKSLETHLICTCLDQFVSDASSEVLYTRALLTGKLAFQVGALFDIVGHLTAESRKVRGDEGLGVSIVRILQTQPAGRIEAKDRSPGGKLGAFLAAPTMPKIVQRLGLLKEVSNE